MPPPWQKHGPISNAQERGSYTLTWKGRATYKYEGGSSVPFDQTLQCLDAVVVKATFRLHIYFPSILDHRIHPRVSGGQDRLVRINDLVGLPTKCNWSQSPLTGECAFGTISHEKQVAFLPLITVHFKSREGSVLAARPQTHLHVQHDFDRFCTFVLSLSVIKLAVSS